MWFSAFFVCPACRRRLTRRERCPCGTRQLLSLTTEQGRAFYGKLAGPASSVTSHWRFGWRGTRSMAPVGAAVLLCLPTLTSLLAESGPEGPAFALPQGLVLLFGSAVLAMGLVERTRTPVEPAPLRVDDAASQPRGATRLRGRARLATTEIVSAISGQRCLVFGVRGIVGNVQIDDADGGDFDLELPSGERVAVSLEHAVLLPNEAEPTHELGERIDPVLLRLLEQRGISHEGKRMRLAETMIQEGDEIVVEGELSDGGLVVTGYRSAKARRVLGGLEGAPLRVRAAGAPSDDQEMLDASGE